MLRQQIQDPLEPLGYGFHVVSEVDFRSERVLRVDDLVQLIINSDEPVFRQEISNFPLGLGVVLAMYCSQILHDLFDIPGFPELILRLSPSVLIGNQGSENNQFQDHAELKANRFHAGLVYYSGYLQEPVYGFDFEFYLLHKVGILVDIEFFGLFHLPSAACANDVPSPTDRVGAPELEHVVAALGTDLIRIPVYSFDQFVRSEAQVGKHVAERWYFPALGARFGGSDAVHQVVEGSILVAPWAFPLGPCLYDFREERRCLL